MIPLIAPSEYQYQYNTNKPCIKVRTDVTFTLTNWNQTVKFDGTYFTVKGGVCPSSNESIAILTLATVNWDYLGFTFKYDAQNQTIMEARFSFAPINYFPGSPSPSEVFYFMIVTCLRHTITICYLVRTTMRQLNKQNL